MPGSIVGMKVVDEEVVELRHPGETTIATITQTKKPRCFQRGFSITFNMLHRLRVKDSGVLNLDLNLNTGRKVDALEAVNGLLLGINDVDQTLMDAHFEVLA